MVDDIGERHLDYRSSTVKGACGLISNAGTKFNNIFLPHDHRINIKRFRVPHREICVYFFLFAKQLARFFGRSITSWFPMQLSKGRYACIIRKVLPMPKCERD